MRWLLAALAALLIAVPAAAEERILDFDSNVAIAKDGSLDVTETIQVKVENVAINHGIFRDFPTRYKGNHGERVKIGFDLLSTLRDGQSEPSSVEPMANGVRIKIGDADTFVPPGEHTYTIRYRTTRQLGRFADYDELYWNVTGNGWRFPIDHASATITLPEPVRLGQRAVYTGRQGATGSAARVTDEAPGRIRFETTWPLSPYEGMTVAVAFPKGVIPPPTRGDKLRWLLADWAPPLVALAGLAGLAGFLLTAYRRVGRDPLAGTVVPLFSPPDGLSPAAMRYVVRQRPDNRGFAAALVDAAIKGHVRLVDEKGGFFSSTKRFIECLGDPPGSPPLDEPEAAAIARLGPPGTRLEMDNANHTTFSAAKDVLAKGFKSRFDGVAFNRNTLWAVGALVGWALVLALTATAVVVVNGLVDLEVALVPLGLIALSAFLLIVVRAKGIPGCVLSVFAVLSGGFGLFSMFPLVVIALSTGNWLGLVIAAIGLPFALSAFWWIDAPTKAGQAMLDRIAGFKQYLSITERDRLDRMQAPEDTLQLFERYLPHAIALDVENRWADRFADQLAQAAAAAAAQGGAQQFAWYSGSADPWQSPGDFVESVGSSLSSSISSASTAPGSSSGSGGGGSSGGGGGGGGGGGW